MKEGLATPAGPRGIPLLGVVPAVARDPFGYCTNALLRSSDGLVHLDLGLVARLRLGSRSGYLVSNPDYVHSVLVADAASYGKGPVMDGIRQALGNGLFTAEADSWLAHRRLMQPVFKERHAQLMNDALAATLGRARARWSAAAEAGQPLDMLEEFIHLNIDAILGILLGATVDRERSARLMSLTREVFRGMAKKVWTFFLPAWIPLPSRGEYQRAIGALDAEVYGLIRERREQGAAEPDLLSALISAEVDGRRMTDLEIRDEVFTIFLAGYESTASALTWACYQLDRHPRVADKLHAEVSGAFDGRPPTMAAVGRLEYLDAVLRETLRVPAFPMFFRTATRDTQLGPYRIARNAPVIINSYATHHDPRYWDAPDEFIPERFAGGSSNRHAYYPFGKGQRICIGQEMSMGIARLVLATLVQGFRFELVPGTAVVPEYAMTYQPRYGLPLRLTRR